MTITEKHINSTLAIILILGWFMPLGYTSQYVEDSVSLFSIFYHSLFYIDKLWISIIEFIGSGSIIGALITYIVGCLDNSIFTNKWFKYLLLFSVNCSILSFVLFHFEVQDRNLFLYVYHLLFFYFTFRVNKNLYLLS